MGQSLKHCQMFLFQMHVERFTCFFLVTFTPQRTRSIVCTVSLPFRILWRIAFRALRLACVCFELKGRDLLHCKRPSSGQAQRVCPWMEAVTWFSSLLQSHTWLGDAFALFLALLLVHWRYLLSQKSLDSERMCSQSVVLFLSPGRCASCGENVVGEGTGCTAMDQVFHVDCFVCMTCSTKLRGKPFYAVEKKAYCEPCYIVSNFFPFKSSCLYIIRYRCARNVTYVSLQATTFCFIKAQRPATSHHTHIFISSSLWASFCPFSETLMRLFSWMNFCPVTQLMSAC